MTGPPTKRSTSGFATSSPSGTGLPAAHFQLVAACWIAQVYKLLESPNPNPIHPSDASRLMPRQSMRVAKSAIA